MRLEHSAGMTVTPGEMALCPGDDTISGSDEAAVGQAWSDRPQTTQCQLCCEGQNTGTAETRMLVAGAEPTDTGIQAATPAVVSGAGLIVTLSRPE